jgi:hypothetical protein
VEAVTHEAMQRAVIAEALHMNDQTEIAELREIIANALPPISDNQEDLRKVVENWKEPQPPILKAKNDPTPVPSPPTKSGDNIPTVKL